VAAEIIDIARLTPKPWKNGAGVTRELAVHPAGAGMDDFDWRLSIADIASDAPFSAFPGVDRCIVLLQGAGMQLRSDDGRLDQRLAQPLEPFHFSGDDALQARLIDGPSSDFNVMTRRDRWRADVTPLQAFHEAPASAAAFLLCRSGEAALDAGNQPMTLRAGQASLWRHDAPSLRITPSPAATLLLVQLHPLCEDAAVIGDA
jgi:environmental stress-induced protein Ves